MMLVTGDFKAWEPKLKRTSMIHINFDEKHFWTVTKDAKMTIPDIIGNIGGTLGVFIGFSFLGLLDTIMEFFQYLMRKKMRLQKQKRRHHRPKSLKAQKRSILSLSVYCTKDTKIKIPDIIRSIGGTLGVFIGFSIFYNTGVKIQNKSILQNMSQDF